MTQRSDFLTRYSFWRPMLFAAGICGVSALICRVLVHFPADDLRDRELLSLKLPDPSFGARQVVAIQLSGLSNHEQPALGALQCYCFASPANRIVTGPFPRFAQMVRLPPYDRLGDSLSYSIGAEQPMGEARRVLVTAVGPDRQLQVFAFVVELQEEAPFVGCWMTSGVFALLPVPEPPTPDIDAIDNVTLHHRVPAVRAGMSKTPPQEGG